MAFHLGASFIHRQRLRLFVNSLKEKYGCSSVDSLSFRDIPYFIE